jgi:hypothetical protein
MNEARVARASRNVAWPLARASSMSHPFARNRMENESRCSGVAIMTIGCPPVSPVARKSATAADRK